MLAIVKTSLGGYRPENVLVLTSFSSHYFRCEVAEEDFNDLVNDANIEIALPELDVGAGDLRREAIVEFKSEYAAGTLTNQDWFREPLER
jgi:hypothetical protein